MDSLFAWLNSLAPHFQSADWWVKLLQKWFATGTEQLIGAAIATLIVGFGLKNRLWRFWWRLSARFDRGRLAAMKPNTYNILVADLALDSASLKQTRHLLRSLATQFSAADHGSGISVQRAYLTITVGEGRSLADSTYRAHEEARKE